MNGIKKPPHSRGLTYWAWMLKHLQERPMTVRESAIALDRCDTSMYRVLRRMLDLRILYVAGWTKPNRGVPQRRYATGPGEDVPPPINARGQPSDVKTVRLQRLMPELVLLANIWHALEAPCTAFELCDLTGIERPYAFLRYARSIRLIGIAGWTRDSFQWQAQYQRGIVRDVPRPKPRSRQELTLAYAERKKQLKLMRSLTRALCAQPPKEIHGSSDTPRQQVVDGGGHRLRAGNPHPGDHVRQRDCGASLS